MQIFKGGIHLKSKTKNIINSVAFLLVLCLIFLILSYVFVPKTADGTNNSSTNGIFNEADNTIDVLFLGDSETYSAFIPLQIWKEHGITSYVSGTSAQILYYTEQYLHEGFEMQQPKVVVLETNTVFRNFSYESVVTTELNKIFPFFTNHNRWKNFLNDFNNDSPNKAYLIKGKGYRYSPTRQAGSGETHMKPSSKCAEISEKNKNYVADMISFCKEQGAEFIFISSPSVLNWTTEKHNAIQELADKYGVDYVDLNTMKEEVPINWTTDTRDKGDHVNYYGAKKVTAYVGKYLSEKGTLPDRRSDAQLSSWNDDYDCFVKLTNSN